MAKSRPLQTAFTSGVLNPGLAARLDIQHYYQGMRRGLNVLAVKEGGARGRWGLQHICDMPGDGRLVPFSFNTEQNYVLWFGATKMQVVYDDALVPNINGSGFDYLVTPYTEAQTLELDYTQSADTLLATHEDVAPQSLVRGLDHDLWTIGAATLSNLPKYDFNDADSPTPTSHVVDLTFNSFQDGDHYKIELNNFETPEIIYSGGATAAAWDSNQRRIKEELLALPPTGFDASGITVLRTGGTTYRITFSEDSADAYEPMSGHNTDDTAASMTFSLIATGVGRREDVISSTRGWPRSTTFYESRLLFGGTKFLPQSLLGTVIGGFAPFDFKLGTGLDDEGIFVTLNTDQINHIRALYAGRHLQLFTSGGEFYSPDRPITPGLALPRQSRFGSAAGIKPVEVDGATIFCTRQRKSLREYLFLWAEEAYNATSLTVLASHLVSDMRSLAAQTSTSDEEDSYVIAVNGDGSAAVLNTLRAQDIASWTEMLTRDGDNLKQVTIVGDAIYFLVERQRNGATVYTVEKATFDTRLDASKTVTTGLGTTVGGFEHLAGETVQILVDGAPVADQVVSAIGTLTFAPDSVPLVSVEAGYFSPPIVETMPLVVNVGGGPMLGAKKRLAEIRVAVLNTLGLIVNGTKTPDKAPGVTVTSTPDAPYTGLHEVGGLGWTRGDSIVTLTQDQPLPFHVLAVAAELEVGDA